MTAKQKVPLFIQNRDFEIEKLNLLVKKVNELLELHSEASILVEALKKEKGSIQLMVEDFIAKYGSIIEKLPNTLDLAKNVYNSPIVLPPLDIQIVDNNFIINGVNIGPVFNFKGPIGPTGPRGIQGPPGPKGEKGEDGEVLIFKMRQIISSEEDLPSRSAAEELGLQTTDVYLVRPSETSETNPGKLYRYNPEVANSDEFLEDGVTPNPLYNKPFEFVSNLIGAKGDKGEDGEKIILTCVDGYIKYKYENSEELQNLVSLEDLKGTSISTIAILEDGSLSVLLSDNTVLNPGKVRRDIELRLNEDEQFIQWKYIDSSTWYNLLNVSSITGKSISTVTRSGRDMLFTFSDLSTYNIPQAFPEFIIDNINLLNPTEPPSATLTVDSSNTYRLSLSIPKAKDGVDGVSPKIRSNEIEEGEDAGHWLQISNDGGETWQNTYKLENIISGIDFNFVNNLTSMDSTKGLAASQGPAITNLISSTMSSHIENSNPHPNIYADKNHNHDSSYPSFASLAETLSEYSKTNHTHAGSYASINHNHNTEYYTQEYIDSLVENLADINHNHDEAYASLSHSHDYYATTDHDHDEVYAKINHTHEYAEIQHDHDNQYAAISHTHDEYLTDETLNNFLTYISTQFASKSHSHINYLTSVPYATQSTVGGVRINYSGGNLYIYTN